MTDIYSDKIEDDSNIKQPLNQAEAIKELWIRVMKLTRQFEVLKGIIKERLK